MHIYLCLYSILCQIWIKVFSNLQTSDAEETVGTETGDVIDKSSVFHAVLLTSF